GSGKGDETLIPSAAGVSSAVVGAAEAQPELPNRHSKQDRGQHVAGFMEQEAGREGSSDCEAQPKSEKPDAEQDAQGKQKPPCLVHPERNPEFAHPCTSAKPQLLNRS